MVYKSKDKEIGAKLGETLDKIGDKLEKKFAARNITSPTQYGVDPDFDFRPWMERELYIRTKGEGLQQFRARQAQIELNRIIYQYRANHQPIRFMITKSRQLGCTTDIVGVIYSLTSVIPHRSAQIVAHRRDSARKIHRINRRFYNSQNAETRRPLEGGKPTKDGLQFAFPHDSEINIATAGGEGIGRSETIHYSLYSEFAFWENAEDVFDGLIQNVPHPGETWDSIVIIETTANGRRNLHYSMWKEAQSGRSGWLPIFLGWTLDPSAWMAIEPGEKLLWEDRELAYQSDYSLSLEQLKWARYIRETQCRGSWERFHTEYPVSAELAFAYSGFPWFSVSIMDEAMKAAQDPVKRGELHFKATDSVALEWKEDKYGDLHVWEEPNPGEAYAIGMDVGEGVGADYTEIIVLGTDPGRVVAHFRSNRIRPGAAGVVAYMVGAYYNWALLCVERNAVGNASLEAIEHGTSEYTQIAGGYPNLFYEVRIDKRSREVTDRMGWGQARKQKEMILANLAEDFDNEQLAIPSAQILTQMSGFGYNPERRQWEQSIPDQETDRPQDDSIMALALGNEMRRMVESDTYCPGIPARRF